MNLPSPSARYLITRGIRSAIPKGSILQRPLRSRILRDNTDQSLRLRKTQLRTCGRSSGLTLRRPHFFGMPHAGTVNELVSAFREPCSNGLITRPMDSRCGASSARQSAAMDSYRVGVRRVLPLFAKAPIVTVRRPLPPDQPGPALQQLLASISKTDYATNWNQYQHGPTLEDHVLGIVVRLIPKIGILKILAIKPPSAQTEELFVKSLNVALTQFQTLLAELSENPSNELALANRDLDTGPKVRPGAYKLTDRAYASLLHKVTARPGLPIPSALRENILAYYADPEAPISTKRNRKAWNKVLARLKVLENPAADGRQERRQR